MSKRHKTRMTMETNEPAWPKDDLQSLLSAMKRNLPKCEMSSLYTRAQRRLDWEKVAFQPYSSEQCQLKWQQMLDKMRKTRSLIELINEAEGVIENPFDKKNLKIHPEFQRQPANEVSLFIKEEQDNFQKKNPGLTGRKLLKFMSEDYKKLPQHKKDKYAEKFKLVCEEYQQRIADYGIQNYSDKMPQRLKNLGGRLKPKRKRRDDEAGELDGEDKHQADGMPVKAPVNGFAVFAREQRASAPGVTSSSLENIKLCGKKWRQMTQTQKEEYNRRSRELKKQYEERLKQFLVAQPREKQQQLLKEHGKMALRAYKKSFKPVKRIFPGEPKALARSGNTVFCGEKIKLGECVPNKVHALATVSQTWKSLSEQSKRQYQQKACDNFERYTVELRQWFSTLTPKEQEEYLENKPKQSVYLNPKEQQSKAHCYKPPDSEDDDTEENSSEEETESDSEIEEESEDNKQPFWTYERFAVKKRCRLISSSESDAGD